VKAQHFGAVHNGSTALMSTRSRVFVGPTFLQPSCIRTCANTTDAFPAAITCGSMQQPSASKPNEHPRTLVLDVLLNTQYLTDYIREKMHKMDLKLCKDRGFFLNDTSS
jgi:hypothetical protein